MKKLLSLLLIAILLLTLAPVQTADAAVKLNKSKITLYKGNTYTLKISGTSKAVKWSTSDKKIVTVSSKGKITAVTPGQATITAKVSSKKYTCKVTVKEAFSAKNALKNILYDETDLGNGIIVILENKYLYDFSLEATAVFYDDSDNMLGKSNASNYYFVSGTKCALYFNGPYDGSYQDVPYASYKITYSIAKTPEYYKSNIKDIKINSNYGADNVMVEITNDGEQEADFTLVSIVFYKDGTAISYDYTYADIEAPGNVDYLEFSFPYDDNYDTIQVDDYSVFVNYSYYTSY